MCSILADLCVTCGSCVFSAVLVKDLLQGGTILLADFIILLIFYFSTTLQFPNHEVMPYVRTDSTVAL